MILYDKNYNLIGVSRAVLGFLGYNDLDEFKSIHEDFAELFVEKKGYIYKFKNFPWIEYVLYGGGKNKRAVISLKNSQEVETELRVREIELLKNEDGNNKFYVIELINDFFDEKIDMSVAPQPKKTLAKIKIDEEDLTSQIDRIADEKIITEKKVDKSESKIISKESIAVASTTVASGLLANEVINSEDKKIEVDDNDDFFDFDNADVSTPKNKQDMGEDTTIDLPEDEDKREESKETVKEPVEIKEENDFEFEDAFADEKKVKQDDKTSLSDDGFDFDFDNNDKPDDSTSLDTGEDEFSFDEFDTKDDKEKIVELKEDESNYDKPVDDSDEDKTTFHSDEDDFNFDDDFELNAKDDKIEDEPAIIPDDEFNFDDLDLNEENSKDDVIEPNADINNSKVASENEIDEDFNFDDFDKDNSFEIKSKEDEFNFDDDFDFNDDLESKADKNEITDGFELKDDVKLAETSEEKNEIEDNDDFNFDDDDDFFKLDGDDDFDMKHDEKKIDKTESSKDDEFNFSDDDDIFNFNDDNDSELFSLKDENMKEEVKLDTKQESKKDDDDFDFNLEDDFDSKDDDFNFELDDNKNDLSINQKDEEIEKFENELSLYDVKNVSSILGLDESLVKELVNDFIAQTNSYKDDFKSAIEEKNYQLLNKLFVKLNGVAVYLMIDRISAIIEEAQQNVSSKQIEGIKTSIEDIDSYISKLKNLVS